MNLAYLRRMIGNDSEEVIQVFYELEMMPIISKFMEILNNTEYVTEVTWILSGIFSCDDLEAVTYFANKKHGVVKYINEALEVYQDGDEILSNIIFLCGNYAFEPSIRDDLFITGLVCVLKDICKNKRISNVMALNIVWCLTGFTVKKIPENKATIFIEIVSHFIHYDNLKVVSRALEFIVELGSINDDIGYDGNQYGFTVKISSMILDDNEQPDLRSKYKIKENSLKAIGTIALTQDLGTINDMLEDGILDTLMNACEDNNRNEQKAILWIVSNLALSSIPAALTVFQSTIFGHAFECIGFEDEDSDIRGIIEEATYLINVVFQKVPDEFKISMFKQKERFLYPTVDMLTRMTRVDLKVIILESLLIMFKVGEDFDNKSESNDDDMLVEIIDAFTHAGGPEIITSLGEDTHEEISKLSWNIARYLTNEYEQLRDL